jgi:4-amino-4-deoxy-L-arabinose transferase-like glycosyltransferase
VTTPERRRFFILLLIAFVVLAAGIGLRSPWAPDEPRFALIARDMALDGEWLFPHVGGVLYPDKPPLFFWLVAATFSVVRSIDVALLLPALISGVLVTALIADLGRRLWGAKTGLWCGAVLLSLVQFPLQMKSGQIDSLLCLWTTLGLYGFCRHLLLGPDWRWYGIGGLAAGLGIITKGVGFLTYLVFLPWALAAWRDWPRPILPARDWRWLIAPLLTLVTVGAWLVPMLAAVAGSGDPALAAYRDNILFHQTLTRYAEPWGHIKPPWYLVTNAVSWLWLPATLYLPWLLPAWRRDFQRQCTPVLVLAGWIILVLLFFTLSAGKRSVYIFPATPALALLVGLHAPAILAKPMPATLLRAVPAALGVLLVVLGACVQLSPAIVTRWLPDASADVTAAKWLLCIGILTLVSAFLMTPRRRYVGYASAIALTWIGFAVLIAPLLDADRSGRSLMSGVERRLADDTELGLVDWTEQFLLQARRPVFHFGYRRNPDEEIREAVQWLSASVQRSILLPDRLAVRCFEQDALQVVGRAHRRIWVLADASMLNGHCVPSAAHPIPYPVTAAALVAPKDIATRGL